MVTVAQWYSNRQFYVRLWARIQPAPWQKNKPECIILGTGYAKGKQIEAVKIECCFTLCNGGVEMKPTNKKHWLMAATAQLYNNRQFYVRLRVRIQPAASQHREKFGGKEGGKISI
jgi:hypothetical protein